MVNENVSLVISRQILSEFCAHLSKLTDLVSRQAAHYTLEKVSDKETNQKSKHTTTGATNFGVLIITIEVLSNSIVLRHVF